jgi:plastocyanin
MRLALTLATSVLLAIPLAAQQEKDPDAKVKGGGKFPPGWSVRLDKPDAGVDNVKFEPMGPGLHTTTGPAVILWRDENNVSGNYHVVATFAQTKAPTHPEAYGLFIAGKDLNGEGQAYTYFLVRGNGMFLIKKRTGATTANVTEGWKASDAVVKQDATSGKASNKLEISVNGTKVTFSVNGKEVHSMEAPAGSLDGVAGLRVNHNLDVHIEGFGVHKM